MRRGARLTGRLSVSGNSVSGNSVRVFQDQNKDQDQDAGTDRRARRRTTATATATAIGGGLEWHRSFVLSCLLIAAHLAATTESPGAEGVARAPSLVMLATDSGDARDDDESVLAQWESDRFAERQEATMRLRRRGVAGIPLLQRAAEQGRAETRARALQLLEDYYRNASKDREDLRDAARKALEDLATGEGAAARRAQSLLNPRPDTAEMQARIANLRAIQIQAQIQGQIQLRAARRLPPQQMPPVGGANPPPAPPVPGLDEKQPDVRRPGVIRRMASQQPGRKIEITEDADGIHVEVTETKDGESVTEKFQVKDAEALQARHSQAFDVYRRVLVPPQGRPRRIQD